MTTLKELQDAFKDDWIVYGGHMGGASAPLQEQYQRMAMALGVFLSDPRIRGAVEGTGVLPKASSVVAQENFGRRKNIYEELATTLRDGMQGKWPPTFRGDIRTRVNILVRIAEVFSPPLKHSGHDQVFMDAVEARLRVLEQAVFKK